MNEVERIALGMIHAANATNGQSDIEALSADLEELLVELCEMADDTGDDHNISLDDAARELTRRIGGLCNLQAYLNTLKAKPL